MGERRGGRRPIRPDRLVVAGVLALVLVLSGGVAWAFWAGSGTAGPGPLTSWRVPSPVATCTDTDGDLLETAVVSWPEVTDPHVLDYTATINGAAAPVQDDGNTRSVVIDQAMLLEVLGSLVDGTLTVEVTAVLPGTSWTSAVTTETIESQVSALPTGLTLDCAQDPACFATFVVVNEWPEGFQGTIVVTAGDTAITSWSTTFDLGSATITGSWNAVFSGTTGEVTASNLDWNGSLQPGDSTSFGFSALRPVPAPMPVSCTGG